MLQRKRWWVVCMTAVLWQQILVGRECLPCMGSQIWFIQSARFVKKNKLYLSAVLAEIPFWVQSVGRSSQQGIAEVLKWCSGTKVSWKVSIPPWRSWQGGKTMLNSETWRNTWQPRLQFRSSSVAIHFEVEMLLAEACAVGRFLSTSPQGPQFPLVPTSSMGWRQVTLGTVWVWKSWHVYRLAMDFLWLKPWLRSTRTRWRLTDSLERFYRTSFYWTTARTSSINVWKLVVCLLKCSSHWLSSNSPRSLFAAWFRKGSLESVAGFALANLIHAILWFWCFGLDCDQNESKPFTVVSCNLSA